MHESGMRYTFFLILIIVFSSIYADRSPINLVIPYDPFIVPPVLFAEQRMQWTIYGESGAKNGYALNSHGDRVDPLLIWNDFENVVTMLDGSNNPEIIELRNRIGDPKTQHSGQVKLSADFKEKFAAVFAFKGNVAPFFYLALYLPFYGYELKDVYYQDFTGNTFPSDKIIKFELTDHLKDTLLKLGDLDINPWSRSGTGDTTVAVEWYRTFSQNRPLLKSVAAQIHAGVTLPTCRRADINKLLAFSFGSNGAFSIPFGAAIDLQYGSYLHCGLDVLLIHTFAATEKRRIKTAQNQTEMLLLNTAETYTDFGLTQRFLLYGSLKNLLPYCSLMVAYDFEKQGEDIIYIRGNEFQTNIAQSALCFDDRTMHQFIGTFGYQQELSTGSFAASFVTRVPFNGKRVLLVPTVGCSLSFAF